MSNIESALNNVADPLLRSLLRRLSESGGAEPLVRSQLEDFADWLKERSLSSEADQVIEFCVSAFHTNWNAMLKYGVRAIEDKKWALAAKVYREVRKILPYEMIGYQNGGWALWEAGQFDEADMVLAEGMQRFPTAFWLKFHHAYSAVRKQDWPEAARRFDYIRRSNPEEPTGYIEGGWALREAGRVDDAEGVLEDAIEKFPDEHMAWFHYGRNATALANWSEAVRRWEACKSRFPDETFWQTELTKAIYEQSFSKIGDADNFEAASSGNEHTARDILMHFESIGDNCEFGLTQRHFGAEPLGLLRFGEVPSLDFLLESLEDRFSGVGDPANTSGYIGYAGEHIILSTKGFRMMHSHVYETANASLDSTIRSMIPRLKYLTRRLLESLSDASKIWVYKQFDSISENEIDKIRRALFKYNPHNKLLCIRRPDEIHLEGDVEQFDNSLAIGYVDFPQVQQLGTPPHYDAYLKVCATVLPKFRVNEGQGSVQLKVR